MSSLIGIAVYSTEENGKDECLDKTLNSLFHTVNYRKHKICLSINASTNKTQEIIRSYPGLLDRVFYNCENIGTAKAINKVWINRHPGQHCIKMDDDIVIHSEGWVEEMEAAIAADPLIGQVGLKRKDCWEFPEHNEPDFRSVLQMLTHIPGYPWIVVEKVKHVIGSCVMHSSALLDKVGFLYQPSLYGYDDVIMSHRSYIAGFYSCFLPHINIDHIDDGKTPYQGWKEKHSGEQTQGVIDLVHSMISGEKSIYYGA